MFGYVRTNAAELRLREHECYRSLYCGLCKSMGTCTGQCSRLSLSYDFVFLAALRILLTHETIRLQPTRCLLHPLKKKHGVFDSPSLAYCSHASALLTYHKLRDDLQDEKGFKRMRAWLSLPLFRKAYRRAKKKYPQLDETIREQLSALSALEHDVNAPLSADAPAECFGKLLGAVAAEDLEGATSRLAYAIGNAVGRWIYLIDAIDDYHDDCKKDRYNPFRRIFSVTPTKEQWESLGDSLKLVLMQAESAHQLIDPHPQSEINEIVSNILYLGMPDVAKRFLEKAIDPDAGKKCKS